MKPRMEGTLQLPTPNSQLPTPNSQLPTPNSQPPSILICKDNLEKSLQTNQVGSKYGFGKLLVKEFYRCSRFVHLMSLPRFQSP
jgi:hypothetical protein